MRKDKKYFWMKRRESEKILQFNIKIFIQFKTTQFIIHLNHGQIHHEI